MGEHELLRPERAAPRPISARAAAAGRRSEAEGTGPGPLDAAAILRLQRAAGNQSVVQLLGEGEPPSPVHDVVGSGGAPLEPGLRTSMESAFGASFGDVRIHTDDQASRSADSVGASAYTVGSDIVFRGGQFDPGSTTGQRTLAHELTHVVQQRSGPVDGTPTAGGVSVSDPGDRFERAASVNADAIMAGMAGAAPATAGAPAAGTAQRLAQDEDDEAVG